MDKEVENSIKELEDLLNYPFNELKPDEYKAIEILIKTVKSLQQENDFLKTMYRNTDEFKAIENIFK